MKFNRVLNLFRSLYNVQYPFSFGKLLFTISSIAASDSKWHNNNCLLICLEKAMSPHSSTLAWKIPWTEEPGSCSPWSHWGLDTTERLHFHFSLSSIGEGNGNPLQCSCWENPRDGGAWWAAVYGVAQSRTWLSSSRLPKGTFSLVLLLEELP